MSLDGEPGGGQPAEVSGAPRQVEDLPANDALEVVVVPQVGPLVPRRLAGKFHGADLPRLLKRPQRPIHGGQAERGGLLLGRLVDLCRRERPPRGLDRRLDRVALVGPSLHGAMLAPHALGSLPP